MFGRGCWGPKVSHDVFPDALPFAVVFHTVMVVRNPLPTVFCDHGIRLLKAYLLLRNIIDVLKITVLYFLVQLHL